MRYLFIFFFFISFHLQASPADALQRVLGFETFDGQTESGERCSVEIDRFVSGKVRIFLFNPRVNQFEFTDEDSYEVSENGIRISNPTIYEDNAEITNTFVVDGNIVGIERTFCTYKCWISMRPCLLYR
ncbi:MAG: hypothetical protein WDA09_03990 [Bacteriovoracaceae bacterium]